MLLPRLLKPHMTIALSNDSCAEGEGVAVPPSLAITPVAVVVAVDDMSNTAVDGDDRVVGLEEIPVCKWKMHMCIM